MSQTQARTSANAVNWFEIPTADLDRAARFYATVLGQPLKPETMGDQAMAVFSYQPGTGVGGCLVGPSASATPGMSGTLIYLNAEPSLDAVLARVEAAGGRIATPKVALPEGMGVFAHIVDSEGNRVGLHALA